MKVIDEDKLLLDKAYDAILLSERRNIPRYLGFLNEHESLFLQQHLPKNADIRFFGGYEGAVRLMMGAAALEESFPITALEFTYRSQDRLRHRDFLGSLMALGIRRDTVGDILTGEGRAVIFVRDDIVPFLMDNVDKIGRVGVQIGYADLQELPVPDDVEETVYTLSSLRLDAFVAVAAHLSREKAARLIKNEMVTVDHVTVTEVSFFLKERMTVTIRKYGKFVLTELRGTSKKGKLRIAVRRYR